MTTDTQHVSTASLEAALDTIQGAPKERGELSLIVRRPRADEREVVDEAELNPAVGLVGDRWRARRGGGADSGTQLTLICTRVIEAIAGERARWPLAGDQLYVDLDLSAENLPPGTRLRIGTAVLEIAEEPHTGCGKFVSRFGLEAMKFVNSPRGRALNLRGIYARVVSGGRVRVGEAITVERRAASTKDTKGTKKNF
jgi:MOSC domain-containing protein YiiM